MESFDIGVEGRFRVNGIEAVSGEAARNLILKKVKELFTDSAVFERCWFQPSSDTSAQSPSDS